MASTTDVDDALQGSAANLVAILGRDSGMPVDEVVSESLWNLPMILSLSPPMPP